MVRPVSSLWKGADPGDPEVQALLEQARRDAQNSGRTVEAVLASYGFEMTDDGSVRVVEQENIEPREDTPPAPSTTSDAPLLAALAPLCEDEAKSLIAAADPEALARRAAFLGLADASTASATAAHSWPALVTAGVDPQDIAALIAATPWTPPSPTEGEDAFEDHALGERILKFRDLQTARAAAEEHGRPTWQQCVDSGACSEDAWTDGVAGYTGLKRGSPPARMTKSLAQAVERGWVEHFPLVPVKKRKDGIVIAVATPLPERLVERLGPASFVLLTPTQLDEVRERWLAAAPRTAPKVKVAPPKRASVLDPAIARQSAVQIVDTLIASAIEARATDLHLEPGEKVGRIRFRVDGTCVEALRLPTGRYDEVVSRIKVLAEMDVTERRLPQDGHIRVEVGDDFQNVRIASVPARCGEKLALRMANTERVRARLDELGLAKEHLDLLRELTSRPFGMILATGPVGSGKTTTLYSCLQELDRDTTNVMTIEDPVEVAIDGCTQLEVNYSIGFDFVSGLRALLRQDPDCILVGEIRDEETARISVRASMTGLRVYSTLHTNDSTGAVTALRNFQLSSHLLASSIQGVIAQRLLRRLCAHCRTPHKLSAADRELLGMTRTPKGFTAYAPSGCEHCLGTGYWGRVGVFEIFGVSREIREMILEERSERAIRDRARVDGLVTLQDDGRSKVGAGLTSVEEFRRVLNF